MRLSSQGHRHESGTLVIVGIVLVAAGSRARAPRIRSSAAKDLYASAAYEDALSTLSRTGRRLGAPDVARQVDEYRALLPVCAGPHAGSRIDRGVDDPRRNRWRGWTAADASPRLEPMFADVRKRLLPSLIRERFRTREIARSIRRASRGAEPQLTEARLMIAEAEELGVKDDGLADLSVLVDGFLQLIRSVGRSTASRAAGRPPRPSPSRAAAAPSARPVASRRGSRPRQPAPRSRVARGRRARAHVYSVDDEGVSPSSGRSTSACRR